VCRKNFIIGRLYETGQEYDVKDDGVGSAFSRVVAVTTFSLYLRIIHNNALL
jgi:hypothetical protein